MTQHESRTLFFTLECSICGASWQKSVSSYQDLYDYFFHTDTCPVGCHIFKPNMLGKVTFRMVRTVYGHSYDILIDKDEAPVYNKMMLSHQATPKKDKLIAIPGQKVYEHDNVLKYEWLGFEHDKENDIWYVPETEVENEGYRK